MGVGKYISWGYFKIRAERKKLFEGWFSVWFCKGKFSRWGKDIDKKEKNLCIYFRS